MLSGYSHAWLLASGFSISPHPSQRPGTEREALGTGRAGFRCRTPSPSRANEPSDSLQVNPAATTTQGQEELEMTRSKAPEQFPTPPQAADHAPESARIVDLAKDLVGLSGFPKIPLT